MKQFTIAFFLITLWGCDDKTDKIQTSSKYNDDLRKFTLRQAMKSPISREFVAIYYDESSSLSGNKLLKLYSADSTSIDELYYGAHPMEISSWSDSSIILNVCVYSAHGDLSYRKWYLDNSVDKNIKIGLYNLGYEKNYNCNLQ